MESVPVFHVCMALALIARTLPPRVRSRGLWGVDVRSVSEHGSLSIRGGTYGAEDSHGHRAETLRWVVARREWLW